MNKAGKIAWYQGMFLQPQHFQQWDRYLEKNAAFQLELRSSYFWGLRKLTINQANLARGTLSIDICEGVFRDGLKFQIPYIDDPPPDLNLQDFTDLTISVFLAIPREKDKGMNCSLSDEKAQNARFIKRSSKAADENFGGKGDDEKDTSSELDYAMKNLKISLQNELDGHENIKIAELIYSDETYKLNSKYIPPALSLSLSPYFRKRLSEILQYNLIPLSKKLFQDTLLVKNAAHGLKGSDLSNLLKLQAVNAAIPLLQHFENASTTHPEQLFVILAQLASQLVGLSDEGAQEEFPVYNHLDLFGCFEHTFELIRKHARGEIPKFKLLHPEIDDEKPYQLAFKMANQDLLRTCSFFIAVSGDLSKQDLNDLQTNFPRNIRIGSSGNIDVLNARRLEGLKRSYEQIPPPALLAESAQLFFSLEQRGDIWESVLRAKDIVMTIIPKYKNLKIVLYAIEQKAN